VEDSGTGTSVSYLEQPLGDGLNIRISVSILIAGSLLSSVSNSSSISVAQDESVRSVR